MTITLDSPFEDLIFTTCSTKLGSRIVYAETEYGTLTVCEWGTRHGFGAVDSSFLAPNNNFWVAAGYLDVRKSGAATLGDAIEWVKTYHTSFYSAGDKA